jgi:hypothetical protein
LRPQVAAALAKDPQDRPTADGLLAQLTGTAAPDRGSDSPTQTVLLRTWRPAAASRPDSPARKRSGGRRVMRPALLGLAVLVVAVAATLGFTMAGQPNAGRVPALRATQAPAREHARTPIPRVTAVAASTPASRRTGAAPSPSPARGQTAKPTPTASVAAATTLPDLAAGSYTGERPARIVFDASSGNVVTGISWASWTASGATGSGQSDLGLCLPVCLQAGQVPTTVVLSDPVHGRFTELTESRAGSSVAYTYPGSWPVSAS